MAAASPRGRPWERVRRAAFNRDGWRCRRCGASGPLEAHHEPPLSDGADPYDLAGIVTLCRGCHIRRHWRDRPPRPDPMPPAWRRLVNELRPERTGDVA